MAVNHVRSATVGIISFLIMWCTAEGSSICSQSFPYHHQGICYHVSDIWLSFNLAISYCDDIGGVLTSIHSFEQFNFVKLGLCGYNQYCWIGLHDRDSDGIWEWFDGSELDYVYWWHGSVKSRDGVAISETGWFDTEGSWYKAICIRSKNATMSPSAKPTEENCACVEKIEMFVFLSVICCLVILLLVFNACVLWRQGSIKLGGQNETAGVEDNSGL